MAGLLLLLGMAGNSVITMEQRRVSKIKEIHSEHNINYGNAINHRYSRAY